jgi:hypothetical protein
VSSPISNRMSKSQWTHELSTHNWIHTRQLFLSGIREIRDTLWRVVCES